MAAAERTRGEAFVSHFERAKVYAWAGLPEKAVVELEAQYRERDSPGVIGLEADPVFDPLRVEPGFQAFLKRLGAVEPEAVKRSAARMIARRRRLASLAPVRPR